MRSLMEPPRMGCQGRVTAASASTFILIFASVLCTNGELQENASFTSSAAQLNQGFRDAAHLNSTANLLESAESLQGWKNSGGGGSAEDWKQPFGDDSSSLNSGEFRTDSVGDDPFKRIPIYSDPRRREDEKNEPFFDHAMMTNQSEQLGNHAFLRCRVKNLADRVVSWMRRRDWHILTSGRITYTNDDRFQIIHNDGSDEWTLVIKFVQKRDNGAYECQVSSGRGIIAHVFNLNVLVPQAHILGAQEYHVQQGTVISLVCIIENSPKQSPQYLYWYHNNQMVNYGSGISVHTEPGIRTHSRLTVPSARPQHAGNYTCRASNTLPATVLVYVSDGVGDKPAPIQQQIGSCFLPNFVLVLLAPALTYLYALNFDRRRQTEQGLPRG